MDSMKRTERETIEWKAVCAQYKAAKDAGWDGITERGHPMEQWVHKQRRLHKISKLQEWKRQALLEAGFDFVSPRNAQVPTNEQYADELVAFYKEHGHWSPTQTVGGAGLTKWWVKMRNSNGRVGIRSHSEESARAATQILRDQIPWFSFDAPGKAELNEASGLSFNGYSPFDPDEAREKRSARSADANPQHAVAIAAMAYQSEARIVARSVVKWQGDAQGVIAAKEVLLRAALFSQAASFRKNGVGAGWVTRACHEEGVMSFQCSSIEETSAAICHLNPAHFLRVGYSVDGGQFEAVFRDDEGSISILGYDAVVADQTTAPRTCRSVDYCMEFSNMARWGFAWQDWIANDVGRRRATPQTTANLQFTRNLDRLRDWVEAEKRLHGDKYRPHIGWEKDRQHFKFIEHMVRKVDEGNLPYSHRERLREIDATWGRAQREIAVQVHSRIPSAVLNFTHWLKTNAS